MSDAGPDEAFLNLNAYEDYEDLVVYSIDPGTVNLIFMKLRAKLNTKNKDEYNGIYIDWSEIVDIKYRTPADEKARRNPRSNDDIMRQLHFELTDPSGRLSKIDDEFTQSLIKFPNKRIIIVVELQMDSIATGKYQVPINYAIYNVIHMYFLTKYGASKVKFVGVSGKNKDGLFGVHGDQRKKDTIDVACSFLEEENFEQWSDYIRSLKRPKPAEDVADAYNQGRDFMLSIMQGMGYATKRDAKNKSTQKRVNNYLFLMGIESNQTRVHERTKEEEEEMEKNKAEWISIKRIKPKKQEKNKKSESKSSKKRKRVDSVNDDINETSDNESSKRKKTKESKKSNKKRKHEDAENVDTEKPKKKTRVSKNSSKSKKGHKETQKDSTLRSDTTVEEVDEFDLEILRQ
jgi:hypothetical protein